MLFKALLACLALPGIVGIIIPMIVVSLDRWGNDGYPIGALLVAAGVWALVYCISDFYVSGKGTIAPWSPPQRLVTGGLYRFVRNPMYISIIVLVLGIAIAGGSPLTAAYAILLAIIFHWRVLQYEELWLALQFPDEWSAYAASVPRWLPKRPSKHNAS